MFVNLFNGYVCRGRHYPLVVPVRPLATPQHEQRIHISLQRSRRHVVSNIQCVAETVELGSDFISKLLSCLFPLLCLLPRLLTGVIRRLRRVFGLFFGIIGDLRLIRLVIMIISRRGDGGSIGNISIRLLHGVNSWKILS